MLIKSWPSPASIVSPSLMGPTPEGVPKCAMVMEDCKKGNWMNTCQDEIARVQSHDAADPRNQFVNTKQYYILNKSLIT